MMLILDFPLVPRLPLCNLGFNFLLSNKWKVFTNSKAKIYLVIE